MKFRLTMTLASLFLTTSLVQAGNVQFTHEGNANGTLAGVPFNYSDIEIVGVADLAARQSFGTGYYIDHSSASITIAGLGSFDFLSPTRTFVNNSATGVGFSRGGAGGSDLFHGPTKAVFANWDMLTPIGPTFGIGYILQWGIDTPIDTTGGVLVLGDGGTSSTFTAESLEPAGAAFCFGDGSGAHCPCGAYGGIGEGCANTTRLGGATLTASGVASFSNDSLQFAVVGVPGMKPGLLLRGNNQIAIPSGDGILCTSGASQRSQVQFTTAGATTFTDFNGMGFGHVANMGAPTDFQFWYRDPDRTCSGFGFNFSNAWSVSYQP